MLTPNSLFMPIYIKNIFNVYGVKSYKQKVGIDMQHIRWFQNVLIWILLIQ